MWGGRTECPLHSPPLSSVSSVRVFVPALSLVWTAGRRFTHIQYASADLKPPNTTMSSDSLCFQSEFHRLRARLWSIDFLTRVGSALKDEEMTSTFPAADWNQKSMFVSYSSRLLLHFDLFVFLSFAPLSLFSPCSGLFKELSNRRFTTCPPATLV